MPLLFFTNVHPKSLGSSGDHLLSPKAVPVWKELDGGVRIEKASTLMSVLEQSALLLADYSIDQQRKLQYDNWAMEIEVQQPETFQMLPSKENEFLVDAGVVHSPMDDTVSSSVTNRFSFPIPTHSSPSVKFGDIKNSPIITLPRPDILKASADMAAPSLQSSQTFFHPGGINSDNPQSTPPLLDRSRLRLGYYVFTTFGLLLTEDQRSIINSHVIGAAVDDATRSIRLPTDQPATFTFYHLQKKGVTNPRCVYWDLKLKSWSTNGCSILFTNIEETRCACNHLTRISKNISLYNIVIF
uniref:GPS domain-containing protein n=1 Tax=Heterorhabditis bacteriophora TaxID=37862 RepID=A0A1I7WBJ4_HETBA